LTKELALGLGTLPPPPGGVQRPSFDIVRVSPAGEAVVAGRAQPGAEVTVAGNGQEIGRTRADDQGQWVITPDRPLPAGGQELTVASRAPEGAETRGDAPVVVIVPDRPSAPKPLAPAPATAAAPAPTLPAPPPESGSGSAVAVLVPPDAAPRLLQAPAGEQRPDGRKLGLDVMDYGEHGDIRFAGTAPPGSLVRVYVDNIAAGEIVADPHGHWDLMPNQPIAAGGHHVRLDQITPAGVVTNRVELPIQRVSITAQDAAKGRTIVQPGQNLWLIARHVYGQGLRYTTIYQANRDQLRDPNKIYPGQVLATPTIQSDSAARPLAKGSSASR
jgi:nucleoid-associated protein YgaU